MVKINKYVIYVKGSGYVVKKDGNQNFTYSDNISNAHFYKKLNQAKKALIKWHTNYYRTDVNAEICEVECTYNVVFKCDPNMFDRVRKIKKIKEKING